MINRILPAKLIIKKIAVWPGCLIFLLLLYCSRDNKSIMPKQPAFRNWQLISIRKPCTPVSALEESLIAAGLVDISKLDTNIIVDLKYSTTENFLKLDLYGDFNKCYLQPDVADKLLLAQKYLNELKAGYHIIVLDAARPQSIQQLFWDTLKMPVSEKVKFVANPKYGSLHNFGAAVDVTLADENKIPLDMGCIFDYIGELAHPVAEKKMLSEGKLTQQQLDNRKLLRTIMYKAGFFNIQTEWWHFTSCYREEAVTKYQMIK